MNEQNEATCKDDRCDICCRPKAQHIGRDRQCPETVCYRPMPDALTKAAPPVEADTPLQQSGASSGDISGEPTTSDKEWARRTYNAIASIHSRVNCQFEHERYLSKQVAMYRRALAITATPLPVDAGGGLASIACNQNDAMRQELAHVGNRVSDLARAMHVDQANADGSWPDLAGRIDKLIDAALASPPVVGPTPAALQQGPAASTRGVSPLPVETAPKDGSYFLFVGTNFDGGMAVVHWDDDLEWWQLDDGKNPEVALRHEAGLTGWLPLPELTDQQAAAKEPSDAS